MGELIFSILFIVFFAGMFVYGYFNTPVLLNDKSVIWYPLMIIMLIIGMLIIHCRRLWIKIPKEEKQKSIVEILDLKNKRLWIMILAVAGTVFYAYMLERVGFVIMTFAAIIFYTILLGEKKIHRAIAVAACILIPVYCIFVYGLGVRLPRGLGVFKEFSRFLENLI